MFDLSYFNNSNHLSDISTGMKVKLSSTIAMFVLNQTKSKLTEINCENKFSPTFYSHRILQKVKPKEYVFVYFWTMVGDRCSISSLIS